MAEALCFVYIDRNPKEIKLLKHIFVFHRLKGGANIQEMGGEILPRHQTNASNQ